MSQTRVQLVGNVSTGASFASIVTTRDLNVIGVITATSFKTSDGEEVGGAVTDVEPAPYVPPTPVTTVESTPVVEEPMVTFEATPAVEEEPVVTFNVVFESNSSGSTVVFGDVTTSFGSDTTSVFS